MSSQSSNDLRARRGMTIAALGATIAYQALMSNFLALFADRMGFSSFLIGTLFLAVQMPAVFQVLAARYIDRHGSKRLIKMGFVFSSVVLIPLILAPQIQTEFGHTAAVIGIFASALAYCFFNVPVAAAWYSLLRCNLPSDEITEIIGKMNRVIMTFGVVATVAFGFTLGETAPLWRFQAVFLIGALANAARGICFGPVKDLQTCPALEPLSLKSELRALWQDAPYRRIIFFSLLAWMAVGISNPFRPLFITGLGFSERFAALLTVPLIMGTFGLAAPLWGALADRYGSRGVYVLSGICIAVGLLLMALPVDNSIMSGFILAGALSLISAAWGGFDSGNLRRLFAIVPQERQSLYMAVYTIVISVGLSFGSFIGGMIVSISKTVIGNADTSGFGRALHYRILFLISAALIILAVGYTRRMMALQEQSASRLLLYWRIRTQRYVTQGTPGILLRRFLAEE